MKDAFKTFIKEAKAGQYFFSAETGLKYKLTKIAKNYSFAIELNKREGGGADNEEVKWNNNDSYKVIY